MEKKLRLVLAAVQLILALAELIRLIVKALHAFSGEGHATPKPEPPVPSRRL